MRITWDLEFVYCVKVLLLVPLSAQVHDTASPQTVLHSHLDSLDTAKACVNNPCPIVVVNMLHACAHAYQGQVNERQ